MGYRGCGVMVVVVEAVRTSGCSGGVGVAVMVAVVLKTVILWFGGNNEHKAVALGVAFV